MNNNRITLKEGLDYILPPSSDPKTTKRLIAEFSKYKNPARLKNQGFDCRLIEKNLYHWEVKLYNTLDPSCQLYNDLELYSLKTGINYLRIHIQFDINYPLSPPHVRIVEPRFRPFTTSHVLTGGTFQSSTLNPNLEVWSPINTVESIVQEIKIDLAEENASIYYDICAPYTEEESWADEHGFYKTLKAKCVQDISPKIEEESLGGRVVLPPSVLQEIINSENPQFPLIFEISSENLKTKIHAGVNYFSAPEGYILMPQWIMDNIQIDNEYPVYIRTVTLPKGTYTKLQPVDKNFLELEQPKEVLETTLRSYLTLQQGQFIKIFFENECYILNVIETKPDGVIDILNTDLEVDFDFSMISEYMKEHNGPNMEEKEEKKEDEGYVIEDTLTEDTTVCENCKKHIPTSTYEMHSLFCLRNNMLCEICGQLIRKSEKQAHHDEFHKEMKCNCGKMVEFYLLAEHKMTECPHRIVKCKYCMLNMKFKDLSQHEQACGTRTEKCEKCNRYIMISELENHLNLKIFYLS